MRPAVKGVLQLHLKWVLLQIREYNILLLILMHNLPSCVDYELENRCINYKPTTICTDLVLHCATRWPV